MDTHVRRMRGFAASMAVAATLASFASAATYTTSLGAQNGFYDPVGWAVGDLNSTYQEWDFKTSGSASPADVGYDTGFSTLNASTHAVTSPGFGPTSTGNYYSFSGDFGATADIYNHGGVSGSGTFDSTYGTHVIVQTGSTLNGDTGNYLNSMHLVDLGGNSILGGDNASALQISEVSYTSGLASTFGPVDYQELIYEFWLPGYVGDFQVVWDQIVHATIDTLRVDTMIAAEDPLGGTPFELAGPTSSVPEPSSAAIMLGLFGIGCAGRVNRRKRNQAR